MVEPTICIYADKYKSNCKRVMKDLQTVGVLATLGSPLKRGAKWRVFVMFRDFPAAYKRIYGETEG